MKTPFHLLVTLFLATLFLAAGFGPGQELVRSPSTGSRLHRIDARSPSGIRELFRYRGYSLPFVTAHRGGGRKGFPENCIATFDDTLEHTFAALEIDPRFAADGAIVVHHDPTLERTTTGRGPVSERTLRNLKELRLKDGWGTVTEFQIPTLGEVLEWARGKTVLVLDQKDVPTEVRVRKIEEHHAESYAMLIIYSLEDAEKCYRMNPNIMMELMIPDREAFHEVEKTRLPWDNIVAFVGHEAPKDKELLQMIHGKGASCIVGTSRNLDRELGADRVGERTEVENRYRKLLRFGADLIETDRPIEVGTLLNGGAEIAASKAEFFLPPSGAQTQQ